jgi:comEA protein
MGSFKLFNRSEQRVVLFLIASALIASAILIITHIQREKALSKIDVVHSAFEIYSEEIIPEKININTASLEELETLPRIGPVIANRIIEYRKTYGKFQSIEEITKVKGIGKKTFEKIKKMITIKDNIK